MGYYILEPGPALTLFYSKNIALKKDHIQRMDEIESRYDRGNSNNVLPKISSHPEDEIIAKLQKLTRQSNYNFFYKLRRGPYSKYNSIATREG